VVKTMGVEFFCYHRDRPGSVTLREELLEEHWSYMDRYQAQMIARGPTLADDGDTPTGSVHIVDVPDSDAARAFAFDEPGYQAGVYRDVLLRRWRNALTVQAGRDDLIAYGPLLSDNAATWLGTAALVQAPDTNTARAILTPDRYADIEVHNWQFGGRPS
jgi:uncharacterized protein YciI